MLGHPCDKGESRISAGKKRIINEFRSEGQIREPGNLLTVSEMKYTVSITDVEGAKVEVLTTGSVSEFLARLLSVTVISVDKKSWRNFANPARHIALASYFSCPAEYYEGNATSLPTSKTSFLHN